MSTNLSSVNGTIVVAERDKMTFTLTFTHQDHSGFTFMVNELIINPNFPCTSVGDTDDVTQTLVVQYHCTAMQPGTYNISSFVTFCNFEYYPQTSFTVVLKNGKTS